MAEEHDGSLAREMIAAIEAEYLRYKALGEGAVAQLSDEQLGARPNDASNSIATICWHLSGNFASRFTDFLTTDGEKAWRARDEEFLARALTRAEFDAKWKAGWSVLLDAIALLDDSDLGRAVTIRGQQLTVREALVRSLAHASYHVGQIVYVAKTLRGSGWTSLSIPPGQSAAYNRNPTLDKPGAQVKAVRG